jgi:hypothetical protein
LTHSILPKAIRRAAEVGLAYTSSELACLSYCAVLDRLIFARPLQCLWLKFPAQENSMAQDSITLAGSVKKLIDRSALNEPQQAQISLVGADFLYDELRVPNVHKWEIGKDVEVTIRLL